MAKVAAPAAAAADAASGLLHQWSSLQTAKQVCSVVVVVEVDVLLLLLLEIQFDF